MTKLTPSRGFCIELASALTVTTATLLGLPISTTQSVVSADLANVLIICYDKRPLVYKLADLSSHSKIGAEIGVGMCDSIIHGINWRLVAKFFSRSGG